MKYLLRALCFFCLHPTFAFTNDVGLKINGVIMEQKQPVPYATISVLALSDSSLVTGGISDENGAFEIKNLKKGSYLVKIEFLGYAPVYKTIDPLSNNTDLGTINLEQGAKELAAVEITSTQRVVEVKIDKKVYNVDKDPATTGATGLEALQNAPSVNVDVDGNISLRGDEGVRILVNGRPLNIPANQFLEQTPASSIEKIEVITNPSAKYNPEGTTGLINIILKKNANGGLNGSINSTLGYGIYEKNNQSLNLNYRVNKLNTYVNLGRNGGRRASGGTTDRLYNLGPENQVKQFIDEDNVRQNRGLNLKTGFDYFIDDNNIVYAGVGLNSGNNSGDAQLNSQFFDPESDALSTFSNRKSLIDSENSSYNINTGWQHKFSDEGHTLDIDLNYSQDESKRLEDNREMFRNGSDGAFINETIVLQDEINTGALFFGKADYSLAISDSVKLEAGINVTSERPRNEVERRLFNDSLQDFEVQNNFTNAFRLERDIAAFYSTLAIQRRKFGYKIGLRAEQTFRQSILESGEAFRKDYLSLFPSAFVSYKMSDKSEWQISYSRRLNRARLGQLNPFVSSTHPYNVRSGNPFLNPEFINNYELGNSSYLGKFSLTTTVYYRQVNDLIRRFITLNDDGVNVVSFKNQSQSNTRGSELIVSYTPNKNFRASMDVNGWISTFVLDSLDEGNNNTLRSYNINASATYSFANKLSLQANMRYNGRFRVQQGVIDPRYGLDLSARMPILNHKGNVAIRFTDVLNTRQFVFKSQGLDYNFDILRKWETRVIYLSFSYNFGKEFSNKRRRNGRGSDGGFEGINDGGF